ncbi:MAG TPA: two-component regulator propeller domain-containing protein [Bacteroidota bacterium]|nr:two-component regulator propeller domain-containing protein [Bacteroidota bacterium]
MNIRKKIFTSILVIFFSFSVAISQVYNARFSCLTTDNGLSHNWVHYIFQDKYGFLWVATDDGLDRYDGYTFSEYKNDHYDTTTLSHNSTTVLYEDSDGRLWVGTRGGLNIYDRERDCFIRHPVIRQDQISSIVEDKNKNLWIGTSINLYRINLLNDSVKIYTSTDVIKGQNQITDWGIYTALYADRKGNVWVGSSGLHLYNKETDSFINIMHDKTNPNSIIDNAVYCIKEDNEGRLWIGTTKGLDLYIYPADNPGKGRFIHHQNNPNLENSISFGTVYTLLIDDQYNLWVGVENGGINVMSLKNYTEGKNDFVHFKFDPNKQNSLNNNSIYSLFQDVQKNIWIGTNGGGVNVINSAVSKFRHITSEVNSKNTLSNRQVNTFLEEGDDLWIGTEGGLNRYNRKTGIFKHYIHNPDDKKSIGANAVWAICKDRRGNLWVGTWGGGLNKFNYGTETFTHYYYNPDDSTSIGSNNMFSIYEDRDGNLWIGTMGGGLNLFDRRTGKFTRFTIFNSNISTNYVQHITESKDGYLWLSNSVCFEKFDKKTKTFQHYVYDPNDSTTISSSKVLCTFEDSKGNLWFGTGNGLNLLDQATNKFKVYRTNDGLPNNFINSIIEDNDQNLWIATNKGISKFINAVNLPEKPQFKNYTYEDGLQGNGFNRRACYKDREGLLYFGGYNGFNVFDPRQLVDNKYVPPVVITEFRVFNKPIPIGVISSGRVDPENNCVQLTYKQSAFSIEFSALNYIASAKNQYAYQLEGLDEQWNYVGTRRMATYTNLSPGEYIFRVKGSNNDGVWNEEGVSLKIIIMPPFWKTWWFRTMIGTLVVLIGYISIRQYKREQELEEEKRMAEAVAEATTKERNLLRTLIDNLPDEIHIKDIYGRIVVCNKVLLERLGLKNEKDVIGKKNDELMEKEFADRLSADEQRVFEKKESLYDIEDVSWSDQKRIISRTIVPLRNSDGDVTGIVIIERDITERKKNEKEREKLIAELQQSLADVKMLSGLIPICSNCKKIRNDQGYWIQLEAYIQSHSDTKFTHGICPECAAKLYPNISEGNKGNEKSLKESRKE